MPGDLQLIVGIENMLEDFAHEGRVVHDQDAKLFVCRRCHRGLRHRYDRTRRLRSHELFDRGEQLIFLDGFGQKSGGAFFYGAIAMLGACARCDYHDGDAARCGT